MRGNGVDIYLLIDLMGLGKRVAVLLLICCWITPSLQVLDQTYFKILGILPSETSKKAIDEAFASSKKALEESKAEPKELKLLEEGILHSTQPTKSSVTAH